MLNKTILVHTGVTVDGNSIYSGLDTIMCRTKCVIKVNDARKLLRYYSPDKYGIHKAVTFGDLRQKIKDLGTLIGVKLIEEDI